MRLDSRWVEVCTVEYQAANAMRIFCRKGQCDVPSIGKTQQVYLGQILFIQEVQQVLGKLSDGKGRCPTWRFSMSPRIQGNYPAEPGKIRDLLGEIIAVSPISMEQHQGKPIAIGLIVERNIHVLPPSLYSHFIKNRTV